MWLIKIIFFIIDLIPISKKVFALFFSKRIIQIQSDDWTTTFQETSSKERRGWTTASAKIRQIGQYVKGETETTKEGVRRWEILEGMIYDNKYLIAKYCDKKNKIIQGTFMLKIITDKKMEGRWIGIELDEEENDKISFGNYIFKRQ